VRHQGTPGHVPVGELIDVGSAHRRRRSRARRVLAWFLTGSLLALGAAGVIAAARYTNDRSPRRRVTSSDREGVRTSADDQARADVISSLQVTGSTGSFAVHYRMSASSGLTLTGDGVVTTDPVAIVSTSELPNLGAVTTRIDGSSVWEEGGAGIGTSPGDGAAGVPLSQFAPSALNTLGRREGAVAIEDLASPTGHLDLAADAIAAASSVGGSTVDGIPTRDYQVTIDSTRLDRPGLTAEEHKTLAVGVKVLETEGYLSTTVRLSIDGQGFIRRAQTIVRFGDGDTVDSDTRYSDFGCSAAEATPEGPLILPNPSGCAATEPNP